MSNSGAVRHEGWFDLSYITSVAIVNQYRVVKVDTEDTVNLAVANTDLWLGIAQRTQEVVGGQIAVRRSGSSLIAINGTVAVGAYLTPSTLGQAVATTTAGHMVFAIAEQNGVAGDIIACQLIKPVKYSSIL